MTTDIRAFVSFRTIAHFFDADDPFPEERRELSERAEEKIFRTVLSVSRGYWMPRCNQVEITLPATDMTPERPVAITAAIRSHFRRRSDEIRRDMKLVELIGLREIWLTLAVCIPSFIGIAFSSQRMDQPLFFLLGNVCVIFCWVTIWQPFQLLVFDRWTQSVKAKIYRMISEMEIHVKPA